MNCNSQFIPLPHLLFSCKTSQEMRSIRILRQLSPYGLNKCSTRIWVVGLWWSLGRATQITHPHPQDWGTHSFSCWGCWNVRGLQLNPSAGTAFGRGKLPHPKLHPCPRGRHIQWLVSAVGASGSLHCFGTTLESHFSSRALPGVAWKFCCYPIIILPLLSYGFPSFPYRCFPDNSFQCTSYTKPSLSVCFPGILT